MEHPNHLFDTHSHLTDESLLHQLDQVIQRASDAGVIGIVAIGTTIATSRRCVDLASKFSNVWVAVGIHPNYCNEAEVGDWNQIVELSRAPKVVALGETGLDLHWDHTPWNVQVDYFGRHIQLSGETGLPLVIHMRDCEAQMMDELAKIAGDKKITRNHAFVYGHFGRSERIPRIWSPHKFCRNVDFSKIRSSSVGRQTNPFRSFVD